MRGNVMSWMTWSFGSEPEHGQGHGTRLTIQLKRDKVDVAPATSSLLS